MDLNRYVDRNRRDAVAAAKFAVEVRSKYIVSITANYALACRYTTLRKPLRNRPC